MSSKSGAGAWPVRADGAEAANENAAETKAATTTVVPRNTDNAEWCGLMGVWGVKQAATASIRGGAMRTKGISRAKSLAPGRRVERFC